MPQSGPTKSRGAATFTSEEPYGTLSYVLPQFGVPSICTRLP